MELTTATSTEFDEFLTARGYSVPEEEKPFLLVQSFDFLQSLEFCAESGDTAKAQCFIAHAMREEAGDSRFDPFAVSDGRVLVEEGLGRNAIVEKYAIANDLSGTDSITMLKRVPMAYNLLAPLLCVSSADGPTNFELVR